MLCFDDIKVELSCQGYKTTHLGISPDEKSSVLFFESQVKTKDVHCPFCGDDVYMHETYDDSFFFLLVRFISLPSSRSVLHTNP